MTQEYKELLLKDLCARLSYGVKGIVEIEVSTGEYSIESGHFLFTEKEIDVELLGINKESEEIEVSPLNDIDLEGYDYVINDFIPYLRPMSSMTEEEIKELLNIDTKRGIFSSRHLTWHLDGEVVDYLNSHHFDYRGLIEKDLALEAKEGMYEY